MDVVAVAAAVAAWIAAIAAIVAALGLALQLEQSRIDREVDFYRKLTPFLSFETTEVNAVGAVPGQAASAQAITIYADGGGYAFNILANIDQTNATGGGGGSMVGQRVLRYLREDRTAKSPPTIAFAPKTAEYFQGRLRVTFVDLFGIDHEAQQAVRVTANDRLETTDAIHWACGNACHVHVIRPRPAPGLLVRLATWLRLSS
jgi:hypothetical protein